VSLYNAKNSSFPINFVFKSFGKFFHIHQPACHLHSHPIANHQVQVPSSLSLHHPITNHQVQIPSGLPLHHPIVCQLQEIVCGNHQISGICSAKIQLQVSDGIFTKPLSVPKIGIHPSHLFPHHIHPHHIHQKARL
jgi:hypothetical protein